MDIIKAFKLDENQEYKINIRGTYEKPLFQANQIAKLLGIKNIHTSINKYSERFKVIEDIETQGGIQKVVFLTEFGLYHLLSNSRKSVALTFETWVMETIKEIRLTGTYQSNPNNEVDSEFMKSRIEMSVHNNIIENLKKKRVIYLSNIRQVDENTRIIKIGSSDNIQRRACELQNTYGQSIILQAFECNDNRNFELYLQHHPQIRPFIYKEEINGNISREMFLLSNETFETLLKIIKSQKHKFNGFDDDQYIKKEIINMKKLEIVDRIKKCDLLNSIINKKEEHETKMEHRLVKESQADIDLLLAEIYNNEDNEDVQEDIDCSDMTTTKSNSSNDMNYVINHIVNEIRIKQTNNLFQTQNDKQNEIINIVNEANEIINTIYEDVNNEDNIDNEDDEKLKYMKIKQRARGDKIQQYHPETFKLLKTYDCFIDIVREIKGSSASAIRSATRNHNIYRGFRWFAIDRNSKDIEYQIPETVIIKEQRKEYLAELNLDKDKIINVYSSQKDAAAKMKLKGISSITRAIKEDSLAAHRYWKFFNDCPQSLQDEYLANNQLPEMDKPSGIGIEMIHVKTKEVLETFNTISDVIRKYPMSRISLKNSIANNHMHNGYLWRYSNQTTETSETSETTESN